MNIYDTLCPTGKYSYIIIHFKQIPYDNYVKPYTTKVNMTKDSIIPVPSQSRLNDTFVPVKYIKLFVKAVLNACTSYVQSAIMRVHTCTCSFESIVHQIKYHQGVGYYHTLISYLFSYPCTSITRGTYL